MIDAALQKLASRPPDRGLESLEADIWAGVAEHERSAHAARRLLAAQGALLAVTLLGALLAGRHVVGVNRPGADLFSPRMTSSASALLIGGER